MQTTSECPHCHGEGKIIKDKCPHCNGEGIVKKEEIVTLNIPKGVCEGMTLNMQGMGNAPRRGGINGDLLIVIEEEADKELKRDGDDLIYNLMLDLPTAILGGTAEVPTVDGRARVTIEPGTQPGKLLRLRGKGLPNINKYGTGDLLVNVMVYIPENLNKEEKELVRKLAESGNTKPTENDKKRIFSKLRHLFD